MKHIILITTLILTATFATTAQAADVDLLNAANVSIVGAQANDQSGAASTVVGDINGDGIADAVVGARYADPAGKTNAGAAYVIFGQASGSDVNLGSLGTRGFEIDGAAAGDLLGMSVAPAGDVNGDGKADFFVAAPSADPNGVTDAGAVYLIYGKSGTGTISVASLNGLGIRIAGTTTNSKIGFSLAGGTNLTGDSKSDLLIGAPLNDPSGRTDAGSVYIVSDLSTSSTIANATVIDGAHAGDKLGWSVTSANGKLLLGAPYADANGRTDSGSLYVTSIPSSNGTVTGSVITGAHAGDHLGFSATALGKFQTSASDYIAVGAPDASPHGAGSGTVYILRTPSNDVDTLNAGAVTVDGSNAGDQFGNALASGDINADGLTDLVAGAYGATRLGRTDAGLAVVVYGGLSGNTQLSSLASAGMTIYGPQAYCQMGGSVSTGDVNGDGGIDVIIGGELCGTSYQGLTTTTYGDKPKPPVVPPVTTPTTPSTPTVPQTPTVPTVPQTPTTPTTPTPPKVKRAFARIVGAEGCVKRKFRATVKGTSIHTVNFKLDGRGFKKFNKHASSYRILIDPSRYSYGVHRVSAAVSFQSGATKKQQTLRFSFQRCKPKVVTPATTG